MSYDIILYYTDYAHKHAIETRLHVQLFSAFLENIFANLSLVVRLFVGGMDSNPMSGMGPDYPGMGQDAPPGFIAQQQQANDQQLVSQRPGSPSEFMGSQGK